MNFVSEIESVLGQSLGSSSSAVTALSVLTALAFAVFLSAIMFLTYKACHADMTYDFKYNITLVMLAVISTVFMSLIQQNIALSLGMLGSLSIVRFRTNIKDPRDLGFVFWSMAIGIAAATQGYFIGIAGSLLLSAFLILTGDNRSKSSSMLLVVRGSNSNIPLINDIIFESTDTSRLKAQNLLSDSFELVYEIRTKKQADHQLSEEIMSVDGVDTVNMLAPSAEMI